MTHKISFLILRIFIISLSFLFYSPIFSEEKGDSSRVTLNDIKKIEGTVKDLHLKLLVSAYIHHQLALQKNPSVQEVRDYIKSKEALKDTENKDTFYDSLREEIKTLDSKTKEEIDQGKSPFENPAKISRKISERKNQLKSLDLPTETFLLEFPKTIQDERLKLLAEAQIQNILVKKDPYTSKENIKSLIENFKKNLEDPQNKKQSYDMIEEMTRSFDHGTRHILEENLSTVSHKGEILQNISQREQRLKEIKFLGSPPLKKSESIPSLKPAELSRVQKTLEFFHKGLTTSKNFITKPFLKTKERGEGAHPKEREKLKLRTKI